MSSSHFVGEPRARDTGEPRHLPGIGAAISILALAALPAAAAARTNQAQTAAELDDELQVIAAVAGHAQFDERRLVCVNRRIEASTFTALPTTDLAAAERYFDARLSFTADPSATPRRLGDETIRAAIPGAGFGESCSGYAFLSFDRIQFSGDLAIALARITERGPWVGSVVLYRLRRNGATWRVLETRVIEQASGFIDGPPEIGTQPGFFAIRR